MKKNIRWKTNCGFTLLEVMTALVVMGILATVAIPLFKQAVFNNRTRMAVEALHDDIKYAQSEAIKKQTTVYVSFRAGSSWCYGLSDNGDCNCSQANSCQIDGVEFVKNFNSYDATDMFTINLPVGTVSDYMLTIDGIRGNFNSSGYVTYEIADDSYPTAATVKVLRAGTTYICSSVTGYAPC